jgi:hypothetical protein
MADWFNQSVLPTEKGLSSRWQGVVFGKAGGFTHAPGFGRDCAPIAHLLACDLPYCCPHGRPTMIQISHAELEKKFARKV